MIFELDIEDTLHRLLAQEDTDSDKKITIEDKGPKEFLIRSTQDESYVVRGTYQLSNLLQELVISRNEGQAIARIPLHHIDEPPVDRISRMIRDHFWRGLTRTIDAKGIDALIKDTKNESLVAESLRVYVPFYDKLAFEYYKNLEKEHAVETIRLPESITPEYVKSINDKPGILALKLIRHNDEISGVPFVVPGGRFNEMYGWDSYFESVGLLLDGKVELAKAMADNFQYEIEHYGKILNANRSYYLTRTQPPFYTRLICEVFEKTKDMNWLKAHLRTAIKEYKTVWMIEGKRLTKNGLNRYLAEGIGLTPECEEGHYDAVLRPYADKYGMSIPEFEKAYDKGLISEPELDIYFINDRSVRESGHDTSYRIDGNCSDLNLVELNAMLYVYERDFETIIMKHFRGEFEGYKASEFREAAKVRKDLINQYLWSTEDGIYYDYDIRNQRPHKFVSATCLTPLWAGLCSDEQALLLVNNALPQLLEKGGIAGCSKASRGQISKDRPQRQWDYPNGWAPHQMMIWKGLIDYGFTRQANELIYRWLYMITRNAVDYNGTIPEKYDVVEATHKVFAEYGNVGTDFEYITAEGFGWMNASFQYGCSLLSKDMIDKLNELIKPKELFG